MITLNLEIAEVNTVLAGLNKLTMEQALSVWQKVVAQAQPQTEAAAVQQPVNVTAD